MISDVGRRWRLLSGKENWKNLLHPLDMDLRRYLVHYGQMAQVTYDTFNSNRKSKFAGDSMYSKQNLFSNVGLMKGNPFKYEVTKYFYATSQIKLPECFFVKSMSRECWNKESNWMGYVAVATDEGKKVLGRRDILIAWRGTIQAFEWASDFDFPLVSASLIFPDHDEFNPQAASGQFSIYTSTDVRSPFNQRSARHQVLTEVRRLVDELKDEEISITISGHSLGGSLATLNSADIVANEYNITKGNPNKICPVTAFVFGGPRIGNSGFKKIFDSMKHLHLLRVFNVPDIIPYTPPIGYVDVGHELMINTQTSNYLKFPGNIKSWHNLEVYLHGISGLQVSEKDFKLEIDRDIALVNKQLDALKDEYLVPGSWWTEKNKGMVQAKDGKWSLIDHEQEES